jgi:hypothetical protein
MRQVGGDQVDVVITHPLLTTASVDLVLGWLYGQQITSEELATINNASVLAAAWLLGVTDLAQLCVQTALTAHLTPHRHRSRTEKTPTPTKTLLAYMQLIDATTVECAFIDAIEDALTNYLCLEGYESLQDAFAKMPIAWLERILEADAFWCPGEFDRYQFAKRVIAKRRKNVGEEEAHRLIFSYSVIYTHMTVRLFFQTFEINCFRRKSWKRCVQTDWCHKIFSSRLKINASANAPKSRTCRKSRRTDQVRRDHRQ